MIDQFSIFQSIVVMPIAVDNLLCIHSPFDVYNFTIVYCEVLLCSQFLNNCFIQEKKIK